MKVIIGGDRLDLFEVGKKYKRYPASRYYEQDKYMSIIECIKINKVDAVMRRDDGQYFFFIKRNNWVLRIN